MRMISLIILILGISGMECRYEILKRTSVREKHLESLAESAVLTLLACYEEKLNTVGGIGITEPTLVDILVAKQPLPVKLFREIDLNLLQAASRLSLDHLGFYIPQVAYSYHALYFAYPLEGFARMRGRFNISGAWNITVVQRKNGFLKTTRNILAIFRINRFLERYY